MLVEQGKKIFAKFLENHARHTNQVSGKGKKDATLLITQPDEGIVFRQLTGRTGATDFDMTEELSGEGGVSEDFLGDIRKEIDAKIY